MSTKLTLERTESVFRIIAVILAGIWTVGIFWYQYIILPSQEPIDITVKTDFKKMGIVGKMSYYLLTFNIKNESKVIDKFPVSYCNILGCRMAGDDSSLVNLYKPALIRGFFGNVEQKKYAFKEDSPYEYFQSERVVRDNCILGPQSEISSTKIVAFPTGKFNMIIVEYKIYQTRQDVNATVTWKQEKLNYFSAVACGEKNDTLRAVENYQYGFVGDDSSITSAKQN